MNLLGRATAGDPLENAIVKYRVVRDRHFQVEGLGIANYGGMRSVYFSGDWCTGRLFGLAWDGSKWQFEEMLHTNLQFTAGEFDLVHALTGVYDPTSPDLTAFQARGGKIIFWQGWADSGASPYMLLNYVNAMAQQMGANTRDSFTKTYMIPGAGHCGASKDLYSPLLNWVEQGQTPGQVNVTNIGQGARDRPVWPHPSLTVYNPAADSFVQDGPSQNSDLYLWRGLSHYMPSHTTWCSSKGASTAQQANLWVMSCGSLRPNTP